MSRQNEGGPAFPTSANSGMSVRQYFAAHCPENLAEIHNQADAELIAGKQPDRTNVRAFIAWNARIEAYLRYAYADAMLSEGENGAKP